MQSTATQPWNASPTVTKPGSGLALSKKVYMLDDTEAQLRSLTGEKVICFFSPRVLFFDLYYLAIYRQRAQGLQAPALREI